MEVFFSAVILNEIEIHGYLVFVQLGGSQERCKLNREAVATEIMLLVDYKIYFDYTSGY